jgi:hypothetical protein
MRLIKHSQLAALLHGIAGVTFCGIETITDARCRKTGNPYGRVNKHCRGVVTVGADYTTAVHNEGLRQGIDATEFKSEPLPWGEWLIPGKVLTHKDKLYLRCQSTPRQRTRPQMLVTGYVAASGQPVTYADIKAWLPPKRESNRQQDVGLVETIQPRSYAFESIRRIRINGVTYTPVKDHSSFEDLVSSIIQDMDSASAALQLRLAEN